MMYKDPKYYSFGHTRKMTDFNMGNIDDEHLHNTWLYL